MMKDQALRWAEFPSTVKTIDNKHTKDLKEIGK
jgi:hypothetical protein